MDDPIRPIRDIRERALQDLTSFAAVELSISPVSMPDIQDTSLKLQRHLQEVADTASRLIEEYESERTR